MKAVANYWWVIASVLLFVLGSADGGQPPTRVDVERQMGLRSEGDLVRGQMDTVGFVVTAEQAGDVLDTALEAENDALKADRRRLGLEKEEGVPAVICPHDDHLYAAGVYVHATELIRAPRVILIGVFHKARYWDLEDQLVFDRFEAWHGPWGPVPVDPLREELIAAMAPEEIVINNTMHCREHSLEAILPFLQHTDPKVQIIPILVPYMNWETMATLADNLSGALAASLERHGWRLGRDVAIVISTDLIHYGPDFEHAPFGTDSAAYDQAAGRDERLIREHLEGPLQPKKLQGLLSRLVDEDHVRSYRIPWCGRFSVPFGLELLRRTAERLDLGVPEGTLLRYGSSLSEPELPVSAASREAGLGLTAPSNFHHWVGYGAVAYGINDRP